MGGEEGGGRRGGYGGVGLKIIINNLFFLKVEKNSSQINFMRINFFKKTYLVKKSTFNAKNISFGRWSF